MIKFACKINFVRLNLFGAKTAKENLKISLIIMINMIAEHLKFEF